MRNGSPQRAVGKVLTEATTDGVEVSYAFNPYYTTEQKKIIANALREIADELETGTPRPLPTETQTP